MGIVYRAIVVVALAILGTEVDIVACRLLFLDFGSWWARYVITESIAEVEPKGCQRLTGPVGAEDAVLLKGDGPPVIIVGELDAAVHEFTSLEEHGTSASTSPRGALWAIDRLERATPRLTRLDVPLPDDVTTMHIHGLNLLGDILFAVNHAFKGGGERIERWQVERTFHDDDPPVKLFHLGAITGHQGDASSAAWSFTTRFNAAINAVAPISPTEVFLTQFQEGPTSMEGGGSGLVPAPITDDRIAAALKRVASMLNAEVLAKVLLPRLRRTRIWHCYCPANERKGGAAGGHAAGTTTDCPGYSCRAVGPRGASWNGIASMQDADGKRKLYVNDIFLRTTSEFEIVGSGATTALRSERNLRSPFLVSH